MKTLRSRLQDGQFFILSLAILACGTEVSAQTTDSNTVPVVTVQATQLFATVTDSAVFTVFRKGNTNEALGLWYDLGGTASNGVDYALISPHSVTIDAGTTSTNITITPLINPPPLSAAKTVVLQLTNSPMLNLVNYEIGSPSSAMVYIEVANPPPVSIISPMEGMVFYTPTNIQLLAKTDDPDGSVTNVEFFANGVDLGPGLPIILDPPGVEGVVGLVYLLNWSNVPTNNYSLTVVATDDGGLSTTSTPVNIVVLPGPVTNPPPVVRIISPANGATFFAPVNIPLYAYANDPAGSVESVQFFDGTNSLGFGQPVPVPTPTYPTNLYYLIWTNAPVGNHVLTAQAMIGFNGHPLVLVAVSDPVKIDVLPSPPPPTNRPPVVSIVATDPVAVEDTNCWMWPGETNATPTWAAWPTAVCQTFTNYGPKTATFTVRRWGDTNDDLTVPYDISGTASNGVDYVTLPGSVTIPAGECRTLIMIVPIDDGPPDVNKTVILTLLPDMQMNPLPGYVLGFPYRSAAIIIDSNGPHPVAGLLPDKCFHLVTPGPDAAWFYVQCSTDLVNWTSICTNQVIDGSIDFVDPDAQSNASRFYRAVSLISPPAN